jgi:hypothetical protein
MTSGFIKDYIWDQARADTRFFGGRGPTTPRNYVMSPEILAEDLKKTFQKKKLLR